MPGRAEDPPMPKHENRLAKESSPYLLQHAGNPVDWYPWGDEAFAKAKAQDKPVFLSIGYSTCHWCHVMERESFEDEETAKLLNERFVAIKVDREERPDVDAGFGGAPKFPRAFALSFLLGERRRAGKGSAVTMVEKTLDEMARGGLHDQIGGGFHRYSTDAEWLVPHFEKMLYDQATLSRA